MSLCPHCGTTSTPDSPSCPGCGQVLTAAVAPVYAPPPPTAAAAHLVGLSGGQANRAHPVAPALPLTLGGDPLNDVVIEQEPSVAPQHARLYWSHPYCCVQDLGSATGTFVNGRRVTDQAVLAHGDVLQLGEVSFRFLDVQRGPTYSSPPAPPGTGPYVVPRTGKDRVAAGVLAILLGAFGIHMFYLNKVGWGLAFFFFTLLTCGYGALITGPLSLAQGILYLCSSEPDFQQKYAIERRMF